MGSDVTGVQDAAEEGVRPSQLFLLRIWLDGEAGENDWHGKVQHAVTGEARRFRSCAELKLILLQMMKHKSEQFPNRT